MLSHKGSLLYKLGAWFHSIDVLRCGLRIYLGFLQCRSNVGFSSDFGRIFRQIRGLQIVLEFGYRKTAAESLNTKYHLEPATCHKLDIDSGRTRDSGARLTYEPRHYVTTLVETSIIPIVDSSYDYFQSYDFFKESMSKLTI
jgi:hypothetical protein